ncbi:MAG: SH3 domain-containing protein [Caldilineaceae bacterium]|nr:SH3 domain-containing protein [Caldilineaceae bacterium]
MSPIRYSVLTVLAWVSLVLAGYGSDATHRPDSAAASEDGVPGGLAVVSNGRSAITARAGVVQQASETPPDPRPAVPMLSIYNPLVIPTGDTPVASGGPYQDWPVVEDSLRGLRIFHPRGWLYASSKEELSSLQSQMGDPAFESVLTQQAAHIDALTPAGSENQFVGYGFQYSPDTAPAYINRFAIRAEPAAGRTLEQYALQLAARLEESEVETLESVEAGPGLRPWGEKTASIRHRSGAAVVEEGKVVKRPGAEVVGWQVVLLSPEGGTFLLVTFDIWGEEFEGWLEPFLRDIVRRVQWLDPPGHEPLVDPTVTIKRSMNLREGSGTDYTIVGTVSDGDRYSAVSTNAAGDWWQIEYQGRLAWVYGSYVTPSAGAERALQTDPVGWLTYDDVARGLSLSYPSEWHYFDPARPSQVDLALFSAAYKPGAGQLDAAEMGALVSAMSVRRDDAVIGLGLQSGPADRASSNFMLVFSVAAEETTLERYAQAAVDHTYSIEPASVELVQGLRPWNEEVVSIRYREHASASEVWQVALLSPDGERLLVLAFSVHIDEFAAMEPELREMVQRVRWDGSESHPSTRPAVPMMPVHNPLVIPVGDTPMASGGPFQDWPEVEDTARGLRIFHPQGWLYASSKEELSSLLPQMGDPAAAEAVLARQAAYFDFLARTDQEGRLVGYGFQYAPDTPSTNINRFTIRAVPAGGRTVEQYALQLAARVEESEAERLESIEVGPGLRPWGEDTASLRYRSGGAVVEEGKVIIRPGMEVVGWQVVLLSPDGGTLLLFTFDIWGEQFDGRLESILRDVVRRVQWQDRPAFEPLASPTVTITRTMYVRGGPGTDHAIISTVAEGEQYAAISTNSAGDWWQIEYEGRLAWVYGGYVKPSADAESALQADPSGWLTYDDVARGLSLSFPSGWHYFDPARPAQVDLSLFSSAVKGREGERIGVAEMGELVSAVSVRRDDAVIGLGLQSGPADSASSNFMLVFSVAAEGTTLERYAQTAAEHTYSIEPAGVELVQGLRPFDEEVVSIRYREHATASEVWQVVLLSPDGERILLLTFSVHSDELAALQPVLNEIVRRTRWAEQPSGGVGLVQSAPPYLRHRW